MSRQLAFTSMISALVMALFALSATVRAEAAPFAPAVIEPVVVGAAGR